jgi:hypothetical protein
MIKNALDIAFENMENPGKKQLDYWKILGKKLENWKNYWNMVNTRICEAKRIIFESPGKCWKILEKNWKTGKITGKWCDFLS